jgi:myosin heavy subunit
MSMGEKIVESNPLMEAFGNAKTLRNNNSSRFGKFTSLHYTQKHTISGCHITNLLLEKSRVVTTAEGERNYHIFYQIQTAKNIASFKISGDPNTETYTNQSGCTEVVDMDDAEEYDLTVASMKAVDISDAEIQAVMSIVASIINIGNLRFTSSDPTQLDGQCILPLACICHTNYFGAKC